MILYLILYKCSKSVYTCKYLCIHQIKMKALPFVNLLLWWILESELHWWGFFLVDWTNSDQLFWNWNSEFSISDQLKVQDSAQRCWTFFLEQTPVPVVVPVWIQMWTVPNPNTLQSNWLDYCNLLYSVFIPGSAMLSTLYLVSGCYDETYPLRTTAPCSRMGSSMTSGTMKGWIHIHNHFNH